MMSHLAQSDKYFQVPKGHKDYAHDQVSSFNYNGKMINRISSKTMRCIFCSHNEQRELSNKIFSSLNY